jgi:hypothetical protein
MHLVACMAIGKTAPTASSHPIMRSGKGGKGMMKTKYKYVYFEKTRGFIRADELWECVNRRDGDILANVFWYEVWNTHVVSFARSAVFSADCLDDISHFLNQLNKKGREDDE